MKQQILREVFLKCSHILSPGKNHQNGRKIQEVNELQKALIKINDRLASLCESSEDAFLDIGKKLNDIYLLSTSMSELATDVLRTMSGREIKDAIEGLSSILDELKAHLGMSESGFEKISQGLGEYLATLDRIASYLEKFRMLVLNLDILGFFTRVEDAHILDNDTGFLSLTNDVKTLSQRILDKSTQIREKSQTLSILINNALIEFLQYKKTHQAQSAAMLERSVTNHEILAERHDTATGTAHSIALKSQEVMEKISDIVSSIQFHDITSQQISHVRTVIDTLQESLDSGELSEAERSGLLSEVCSLQSAQLKNTSEEVHTAVQRVIVSMETIARNIQELLDETRNVTWASDIEGLNFMEELDLGISAVMERLNENVSEQTGLTNTMSSVSSMVSEMSVFVEEIENLGLNLQLIALNARIKAAHIGNEGAALDTISGSIYELSKDSRTDTNVLSRMLASVVEIAGRFDSDLSQMQSSQVQNVESLVMNLKKLLGGIHDMNDSVFGSLIKMNSLGESLVEGIRKTVSGITIHNDMHETLESAIKGMEMIHERSGQMYPQVNTSGSTSFIRELEKYYTMESEYRVHSGHEGSRAAPETAAPCTDTASEFGDNVELF